MIMHDAAARSWTRNASPITAEVIVMTADPPTPASNRMRIRLGIFGVKEQPNKNALKNALDAFIIVTRPYISDRGARNKGPKAYPKT